MLILSLVVVVIWGKIVVEIINTRSDPGSSLEQKTSWTPPVTNAVETVPQQLILNYPDPFLKKDNYTTPKVSEPVAKVNTAKTRKTEDKSTRPAAWPELTYLGRMKRPNMNDGFAILRHKDKEYVIASGDSVLNCRVKRVYSDSVIIAMNGQTKTLKK